MKLQDFVRDTLVQIVTGVQEAQEGLKDSTAKINPQLYGATQDKILSHEGYSVDMLNFDVALTVEKGTETKGGIAVVAGFFGAGSQGKSEDHSGTVSRVSFKVPMTLPQKL